MILPPISLTKAPWLITGCIAHFLKVSPSVIPLLNDFWILDHNNKRARDIPILGTTANLTAGQPFLILWSS